MPEVASQTFDLVGRELNATLAEARTALESYVEQPDNVALLERCAQDLHQVQGVLRLLEIYGAALLAEEMEHVTQYLMATRQRAQEPGGEPRRADARHGAAARATSSACSPAAATWRWCCCRC